MLLPWSPTDAGPFPSRVSLGSAGSDAGVVHSESSGRGSRADRAGGQDRELVSLENSEGLGVVHSQPLVWTDGVRCDSGFRVGVWGP